MAQGDSIQYSSFPSTVASTISKHYSGYNSGSGVIYLSAQSFKLNITLKGNSLTSSTVTATLYYYNWTSGSWILAGTPISLSAKSSVVSQDIYHNCNGQTDYFADTSTFNLWKIVYSHYSGATSGYRYFDVYAYGCGGMSETQYNTLCKGQCIGSAGNLNGDFFYYSATEDDSTAVSMFRGSSDRGSPIAWGSGTYLTVNKLIPKTWV